MYHQITWKNLSTAMQDKLCHVHKMEYCVGVPSPHCLKHPTQDALMRRGLITLVNNRLIVTKAGLAIIPQDRIIYGE